MRYLHPKELLERNRDKEKDGFLLSSSPVACRTCCRVFASPLRLLTLLLPAVYITPSRPPFLLDLNTAASVSHRLGVVHYTHTHQLATASESIETEPNS
jgi:hypothetical protein